MDTPKELIDDLHKQFVNVVSLERNLSFSRAQELADGKVFSGQQAFDNGLIDILGTMEDAIFIAAHNTKIKGTCCKVNSNRRIITWCDHLKSSINS